MAHEYVKRKIRQFIFNITEFGSRYAISKLHSEDRSYSREDIELIPQIKYTRLEECMYRKHLEKWYYSKTGKRLDLDKPRTFSEKIQWLKIYDSTPIKTRLADKYEVREWVVMKIGSEYVIPLLGRWDSFSDIDFNILPQKFVLKCTHGSACNLIVTNKQNINFCDEKKKFDFWMKLNYAFLDGFELQYKDINPQIIAEEFIETKGKGLRDYKVHCFNGIPKFIQVISDRTTDVSDVFYNLRWNKLDCKSTTMKHSSEEIQRPCQLDLITQLASTLSEGFKYVRVDFYIPNDHDIYFGEMTFTPSSGIKIWYPDSYNYIFGDMIKL